MAVVAGEIVKEIDKAGMRKINGHFRARYQRYTP